MIGPRAGAVQVLAEIDRQSQLMRRGRPRGYAEKQGVLAAVSDQLAGAPGVTRPLAAGWAEKGLRIVRRDRHAETFTPPGWPPGKALPLRLTLLGRAVLEARRATDA